MTSLRTTGMICVLLLGWSVVTAAFSNPPAPWHVVGCTKRASRQTTTTTLVIGRRRAAASAKNDDDDDDDDFTWMMTTTTTTSSTSSSTSSLLPETSFGAETVPEGQRPINEYLNLVRAPLFGWASEDVGSKGLLTRLVTVYATVFATICYPISGATFTQEGFLLQKLACSNVGAMTLMGFLMVRLYSGWGYVGSRLKSKVIEYEETGWYDGDVEFKTDAEKQRDMFLYKSNVKPVEDRLKLFSGAIAVLWVMSIVGMNVASSLKPVFNEYDPKILERVQYDDSLAGVAADQSFSRPTYCDNRYYRAVAGGGQGCEK